MSTLQSHGPIRSVEQRLRFGLHLGLSPRWSQALAELRGPGEIQDFIADIPVNFDDDGGLLSVQRALDLQRAQCLEGAFVAACALWMAGEPPWVLLKKADDGEDHVIVPFLREGHWGAISKTNHVWLRWRDPVYQSLRELVMSYFHEFVTDLPADGSGRPGARKTLRAYAPVFDLSTIDPVRWVSAPGDCMEVDDLLHEQGHFPLLTPALEALVRPRDAMELQGGLLRQFALPTKDVSP